MHTYVSIYWTRRFWRLHLDGRVKIAGDSSSFSGPAVLSLREKK